jgi:hypothetical protein
LSSEWPIEIGIVFNIPDEFYNILGDFESDYKLSIENKEKEIKWIHEIGTVRMSINGLTSIFNEIEASIIMILDKSIRPLKKDQIEASLNICNMNKNATNFSVEEYLSKIL